MHQLALAEKEQHYKVKHSRYSHAQLAPAREALALIHRTADAFAAEVAGLCATEVTREQWGRFLDAQVPVIDVDGKPLKGRALTSADRKRSTLNRLYDHDDRVAPWSGTAHGVLQAVNTYEHHEGILRGATRPERNMLRTVTGGFGDVDRNSWNKLSAVLRAAV